MRGLILAAGRGSRMNSLTESQPKCLLKWQGKTLIQWQIDSLIAGGVSEVGIITGYQSRALKKYDLRQFHNENWDSTNMVVSLRCADEWLKNDVCVISYSDIIYSPIVIQKLMKTEEDLVISYDPNWYKLWKSRFSDVLSDAESFDIDKNSFLTDIGKKVNSINFIKGQYMGLLRISPRGWGVMGHAFEKLDSGLQRHISITELLSFVIEKNLAKVKCVDAQSDWFEIDSEDDYKLLLKSKIRLRG